MTGPRTISSPGLAEAIRLEDKWNEERKKIRATKDPLLKVAAILRRGYMEEDDIPRKDLDHVAKLLEDMAGGKR